MTEASPERHCDRPTRFQPLVSGLCLAPDGPRHEVASRIPLLFGDSPKVGFGLHNSLLGVFITEFGLLIAGLLFYLQVYTGDPTGRHEETVGGRRAGGLPGNPFNTGSRSGDGALPTFTMVPLWPLGNWVDRHREADTATRALLSHVQE